MVRSLHTGRCILGIMLVLTLTASRNDVALAQSAPPGFVIENAFPTATFNLPSLLVFMPDGRKLVVEKEGRIWVVTAAGAKLSTPFIDLSAKVLSNDDRGLHGVVLDPDFATNRWVYLLYTMDPDSNGVDDNIGAFGRLERYQVSATNPNILDLSTEQILIGANWALGIPEPPRNRHHMVGTLRFAPDKTLLIGSGDAANADITDAGGSDPLSSYGAGKTNPAEDIGAFRAQTLNSMDGKILRVDKETGNGLSSNPFWDGNPTSSRSRVWLYGLRNPFRFSIRPGTGSTDPAAGQPGVLYIGDVGWNTTEELNIAREGGTNFGWPCLEGPYSQSSYQAVTSTYYPNPNVICSAPLSAENPRTKTSPVLWWDHNNGSRSNPIGWIGNCSIGGVFYTGTSYPSSYQNSYFVADYGIGWIKQIRVDANDNVVSTNDFISGAGGVVDLEADPSSGDLFYIDINTSRILRVRYITGNHPPVVNASINPMAGYAPLTVVATASGSTDPDGDALSFLWEFGDGGVSHRADTSYTYLTTGTFTARVTVTDAQGASSVATFQVVSGQIPPPGNILQPIKNTFFSQNQTVQLQATSADPLQGPATYRWDIDFHHNNHFHQSIETYFGQTASFVASTPNDGEQYSFRVRLSVTQGALTSYDTANIYPKLNLTPSAISFSPTSPSPTSVFQVITVIRSAGEVGSSATTFEIREGSTVLATGALNSIHNGDSLVVAAAISPLTLGQHTITFVVDPSNNLFETNKSDNSISSVVTVAGLVAAYSFDAGTGTTVADVSGNGLTGTIVGATWTTGGKYGNALSFNGTSNYVDLGNPTLLQITGSMTWSAWVKAAANPADDGQIIAKSDDNTGWQFKTSPDTGPHTFGVAVSTGSSHAQRYSTTVRSLNTWYHVAGVYNATAQTLDIYVNGTLDNGVLAGSIPSSQSNANVNVNIGRRTGGFYFNGVLDEIRIYNKALSQSEIQTDMVTPLGSPAPVPPAPILVSPTNGATNITTNPTLTWSSSLGAASYNLQVSTDAAFSTFVLNQSNIAATSFVLSGLTPGGTYFWRVSAANSGGTSLYSTTWSFTTAAPPPPPPAPILLLPVNGAGGVASDTTLIWSASPGALSYRLQVSTGAEFSTTVVDQQHLTTTSFLVTGLSLNSTYYWRVSASNNGGTGPFSAIWNFSTGAPPPPPPAPVLSTPANGATGVATNPALTWNASTGATSYGVQVSTDSLFGTTAVDQSNLISVSYTATGLSLNTKYYWRVNASNGGGASPYSAVWSFTTTSVPPPPPPPALASPANGAIGVATNPTLTWNASTGAASYRLQIATDTLFTSIAVDQSEIATTSYSASGLTTNTKYYWRVSATNTGGTSGFSTVFAFTTVPPPPAPPVLASPANGATGVVTNPALTWNASSGAPTYRFQVSTDSLFGTTLVDQGAILGTTYSVSGLLTNKKYFWRVNATNAGGTGPYSEVWNFTTVSAPVGLVAAYAFDEGTGTTTADVSGNGITGTIVGATWTTQGKYSKALSFNGTTSYVDLGNPAALQLTGSMTWSAWINAAANPADDGQIIAKSDNNSGWQFKTSPDTGPHTFGVAVSSSTTARTQRYSTLVRSLNTWYHVAGVYNAASQTLDIYVNGVLNNGTLLGTVPASQINSSVNVNIGRRTGGYYFNGIIDEVRIYNRALSQAEIQADMNTPLGAPPAPPAAPVLATPANGATGIASNPTLTWNASSDATSYRVQVSTDGSFATTVVDQSNVTATSYALSNLAANTTYYWRVNATNAGATGAYSTVWNFTTAAPPPPPPPPVLATPVDGATGISTSPTLAWNVSSGATSYRVQVSVDPAFATTIVDQSNVSATSLAITGLLPSTTYYWHVNATNSSGTSAYSTTAGFTTSAPPPPPAPPVLSTPANNATGVTSNPTLVWNASAGATSYRVQVSVDPAFTTTVVDQSNVSATSLAVSGLISNTAYYWHVNATNTSGTSAYSATWNFTTSAIPPGRIAAYPFDEGTGTTTADVSGNNITGTISGATWTTQGMYNNALSFNGSNSYVNLNNPATLQLTGSMTLSAWVRAAANPSGDGQIIAKANNSAGWQLKTSNATGQQRFAVAVSPTSSSLATRYSTTVRALNTWYHVAGVYNASARTLDIYVNGVLDDGTLSGTVPASQVNTSVNVNIGRKGSGTGAYFNGLIDEVRVYNRALTQAEIQADMNSPLGTPPAPPTAPVLASPANGATGVASNPTLTWNASSGAGSYRLQVSTDAGLTTTVIDQSNIVTTSYVLTGLASSTTFYWRVNASNTGGTSGYSTIWNFTTAAPPPPPPPPVLATPVDGATGVSTSPTLTWNASTGATSYRVQVSTTPAFATTVFDQSNVTATSVAVGGLASNATYYWHVNATNISGTSAYSATASFTTAAIPAGLVAAYGFSEGSGTTTADASGNGITGTIVGATWTTQGKFGNALSFNGTTSYVDLGNPTALQLTGSMTWSAWVNAAANPPDDGQIVAKSDNTSGWQFKTSPDTGPHTFGVAISATTTAHTQRYSTTVRSLNTWYHVAGVYNASAQTLDIYVNGVLNNGTLLGTVPTSQLNSSVNANIGRRTGGFYFNGIIDEVRIYNRALSQAEIQTDMNTPVGGSAARPVIVGITIENSDPRINVRMKRSEQSREHVVVESRSNMTPALQTPKSGSITFRAAVGNGEPSSYQWQMDGIDIDGANGPTYTWNLHSGVPQGSLRCIIMNPLGSDTSGAVVIGFDANGDATSTALSQNGSDIPRTYALDQNYPNPFNPVTTIRYAIPHEVHVRLQVFSLLGELVATLEDGDRKSGYYQVNLNATDLASGIYIYRIQAGSFVISRKLMVLK